MIDEIRAAVGRHLPGRPARVVTRVGEGWDNVVYAVDGDLLVRVSKEPDPDGRAEAVRREAGLLTAVAGLSPLPVPEPLFVEPGIGALAYLRLPGRSPRERPVPEPARLAPALGAFLSSLHRAPVADMRRWAPLDDQSPAERLRDAELDYREVADRLPASARGPIEDFLARTPPEGPRALVFCHNDLGAEHILVDAGGAITGVIDWTDAAIADPAYDLGLISRDLGADVLDLVLAHYEGPVDDADLDRAAFHARCALIGDIAYGLTHDAPAYTTEGLAHLDRVFSGDRRSPRGDARVTP